MLPESNYSSLSLNCSQPEFQEAFTEEDWIKKGLSLASLSRHEEAILTFEQALALNAASLDALIYKASSHSELGQVNGAFKCLTEALAINRKNWRVWLYCADAYRKSGNTEESLACFDNAEKFTDDKALVLGRKGQLLAEAGKYKEALLSYDMSLSQNPGSAEIWNSKAGLFLSMKRSRAMKRDAGNTWRKSGIIQNSAVHQNGSLRSWKHPERVTLSRVKKSKVSSALFSKRRRKMWWAQRDFPMKCFCSGCSA